MSASAQLAPRVLKEIVDNFRPKTPYRPKIDYGSKHTGLAIVRGEEVLWLAQLDHRTDIKERLDKRRAFRRARRKRKTRYRKPRFLNRRRKDGWLPPSLESRVQNIQTWVERLRKICPIEHISYENAKFDTQLMRNPEMNATRWKVYEVLKQSGCEVECGTGARTKMNRIRLGLPKIHYFDACCVGESTPLQLHFKTKEALFIKAKGRGSRSRTNLDKYGFPRGFLARQKYFFCFQTGDIVKANVPKGKYQGVWFGEVACRKNGSFDMKDKDGKRIAQGISYKYFNIIQRFDGYTYRREGMNIA